MALEIIYDHGFGGLSSPVPLSYLDDDYGNIADAFASLNTFSNYLEDTGSANTYAVTLAGSLSATLEAGLQIQVKIANGNTAASTLNFDGTGAKAIKNLNGSALVGGQLPAGAIATFIYAESSSQWILTSSSPNSIPGSTTNDAAAAGAVGEYKEALFSAGNFPASNTFGDATLLSLTAGDWDVDCALVASASGATVSAFIIGASITPGNSTSGLVIGSSRMEYAGPVEGVNSATGTISGLRFALAVTTTIYLKFLATYTVSTPIASGRLSARRAR